MSPEQLLDRCQYWEQRATDALKAAEYAQKQLVIHVGKLALLTDPDTSNVLYMDEYKRPALPS